MNLVSGFKLLIKQNFILVLIFSLALFLRLYQLTELPNGFYSEEVTNSYVGRFILENGKDLYGNGWPLLYFDKFGDYPPVLPIYLVGLPTFLFGVNEFGARFGTSFFGALVVFPVYYLSMLIFSNKKISLFSALFISIAPWHIVLSRTGGEGIIGLTAFTAALLFVFKGIEKNNKKYLLWSFILFFLTYFLYPSLRILTPFALLPLPFFAAKNTDYRKILFVATILFFGLTLTIGTTDWGKARFLQTSLFQSPEMANGISSRLELLSNDEGSDNVLLARIFHNKIVGYSRAFLSQYFDYFSPRYLFLEAGGQARYYNVPDQGLLFLSFVPLLFFALSPTRVKVHEKILIYFLYLLFISPIPAALTVDFPPHVHRSLFMILPLIILMSYGLLKVQGLGYKKVTVNAVLLLLICIEFIYFWHQYSRHEASNQSILRNDGDKQIGLFLKENRNNYEKIYMPGIERIPIYVLFFTNNFDSSIASNFKKNLEVTNIEMIEFVQNWCPSKFVKVDQIPKNSLIIDGGDCEVRSDLKEISLMMRKDSTKAYRLLVPAI